jgi:ketosteroid isomerase-like protein
MRMVLLSPVSLLLALVAMGCQPPAQELAPLRTAEQVEADVEALRVAWLNAANAGDAAGVASFYTDDAVFVDPYGVVHQGRTAIERYYEQSFTRSSGYDIVTEGIIVEGGMVAGYGTYSATLQGPEGPVPSGGRWHSVSLYQPDGSLKLRFHVSMIPAPMPAM